MVEISIITVTYNADSTVLDCLNSLLKQDHPFQHIVVDGGSTDDTLAILKTHQVRNSKLVSEPDQGIYDAMNKGIDMADGDVVGILNGDDFYGSDNVLSLVADQFSEHQVEACYGDLEYVDRINPEKIIRYWRSGNFDHKKFYGGWMVPHPTFFVRKSVYNKYGGFNLELGSAADYEIMLRFLVKHQIRTNFIPQTLVKMRTGGVSNKSFKNRLTANYMDRKAWRVNGLRPYPWTLFFKPLRKLNQWLDKPSYQQ